MPATFSSLSTARGFVTLIGGRPFSVRAVSSRTPVAFSGSPSNVAKLRGGVLSNAALGRGPASISLQPLMIFAACARSVPLFRTRILTRSDP